MAIQHSRIIKNALRKTPLYTYFKSGYRRYQYRNNTRHPIQDVERTDEHPLVRLGSEYGGWTFVGEPQLHDTVIVSAGLGEDASFDVEFAQRYDATVIIVDPTPRAIAHFDEITSQLGTAKSEPYTGGGKQPIAAYELSKIEQNQLQLIEQALYDEETETRFYKPEVDSHVSHSITNWQHDYAEDTDYITVRTTTLRSLLEQRDVATEDIPLVKLDIEGAEIAVLQDMMEQGIYPRQILVEFDELHNPSATAIQRVDRTHTRLRRYGYELLCAEGTADFLYYHE